MSNVAWSACVCVFGTWVSCAKTAKPIEMTFEGLTQVGQGNHGGPDPPQEGAILGVVWLTEKFWETAVVYAANGPFGRQ